MAGYGRFIQQYSVACWSVTHARFYLLAAALEGHSSSSLWCCCFAGIRWSSQASCDDVDSATKKSLCSCTGIETADAWKHINATEVPVMTGHVVYDSYG